MPLAPFSDALLRSLKPRDGQFEVWDTNLKCFGVRVSHGGSKTFVLKVKQVRTVIGRYPLISLAEARDEAKRILAEHTLGKLRPRSLSYPAAVQEFLEDRAKALNPRTVHEYKGFLARFPLKCQLSEVTHQDINRTLSKITSKVAYNHTLVVAKVFWNWCVRRHYIERAPTIGITEHSTESRARVLTEKELIATWNALDHEDINPSYCAIVRLLVCLGSRRGEVAALRWSWISNDRITWPKEAMKNKKPHWLPLCPLAKSILATVPKNGDLLFPAKGFTDRPFNNWSKSYRKLKKLSGVEGATVHDLRRTWTSMNAAWAPPHILERALSHIGGEISGVAAVYNRFAYEKELRECYTNWEAHLFRLVRPSQALAA